ncbi:hypothetical protein FG386_000698 [Cryptosporidium ryanae]|uniref:uncharacterized protein n=1 Tax=Cryptosporidium ryanae TaxID=515981 RepID=UPI00351A7DC3|nr:hypothetical protein FG386_000698 [Cryptosporidium ryanae]
MEEGYDWDKIRNFQIVDGIEIPTSSLLTEHVSACSKDSNSKISLNSKDEDLSKKISSIPQLLVYPCISNSDSCDNNDNNNVSTPKEYCLESAYSKVGLEKQYVNDTINNSTNAGGFGFGLPFGSASLFNSVPSSISGSTSESRSGSTPESRSESVPISRSGSISGIQHYVMHPGLIDAPTSIDIRDVNGIGGLDGIEAISSNTCDSNLDGEAGNCSNDGANISSNIYGFQHSTGKFREDEELDTEKDIQEQLYSNGAGIGSIGGGSSNNKPSCNQNSTGVKSSSKARNRRTRENSEDFYTSSSKNYSQREGSNGCQMGSGSSPNLSEDLNSIKYYEGFKLPLGDLGRKMLLKKLREIHTQNPTKMEKALTDHGLSYTRIRFASVQQLFKISYVCDVFDYALSIHCEFGRPRHRDSSKGASANSGSGGVQIFSPGVASSPSSQNPSDSKRPTDSSSPQNSGFITGNSLMCIGPQNAIDENYVNSGNQKHLDLGLDSYTPDTSPCGSHRSGSSTSSVSTTTSANSISGPNCDSTLSNSKELLVNKLENDLVSPISIFSANCSPSSSQKKRKTSGKSSSPSGSSYNFTPPPIPVTGSHIDVQSQLVFGDINGNQGVSGGSLPIAGSGLLIGETFGSSSAKSGYLIPGTESNSGTNQNGYNLNFDRNNNVMVLGYGATPSNNGNSSFCLPQKPVNLVGCISVDGANSTYSQSQPAFRSSKSCYLSNDESEGFDSIMQNNVSSGDSSAQKPIKRQKTRSKKRGGNINDAGLSNKELHATMNNSDGISASQSTSISSSSLNGTCIGSNGVNLSIPIVNGGMGLVSFCELLGHTQIYGSSEGDCEELYSTNSGIAPFYQPEPEMSFINGFTVSDVGINLPYNSLSDSSIQYEASLLINSIIELENSNTSNSGNSSNNYGHNSRNHGSTSDSGAGSSSVDVSNTGISNVSGTSNNTNNNINNTLSGTNNGLLPTEVVGNSVCDNPSSTSLYYYTDPFNTSTFDDYYLESTNYDGLSYQGLNSIDFCSSTDFDIDNIDITGCPIIST